MAGFNAPNRVELKDPKPGKVYQIAVFAINGPISAAPSNWLFLGDTFSRSLTRNEAFPGLALRTILPAPRPKNDSQT